MTRTEEVEKLAYTAGVIDSDGCIFISRRKDTHSINYLYYEAVSLLGKNKIIPTFLKKTFGGCIYLTKKGYWEWQIRTKQAYNFIKRIHPFLILKKPEAELIFRLRESKDKRAVQRVRRKKDGTFNKLIQEIIDEREQIWKEYKELRKHRKEEIS